MASDRLAPAIKILLTEMGVDRLKRKAVFLDRDGVINRAIVRNGKPHPPSNLKELEILPDVQNALERLRSADYLIIVVTNQPDVARGIQSRQEVETIHASLMDRLPIDEIRVCYHDDEDLCDCRKPAPGMVLKAAQQHKIDLDASFLVGDRWRDIEAGKRAGCRTIFIRYGYQEPEPEDADAYVVSLSEAVSRIVDLGREEDE